KQFKELLDRDDFIFYEIYNATEGFFGIQGDMKGGDLLLLTDNGIFFEFIPFSEFSAGKLVPIPLQEVKQATPYVLIITTPNGLLRYIIGDVITFTSLDPFKFRITGRTQEYINAFGEDLLLSNVENALMKTNAKFDCSIKEYTVAPFYISINEKGRMQFLIEFRKPPGDKEEYALELDAQLQKENSNYAQKRNNDLALNPLEIIPAKPGLFYAWMASKGKMGGQNKIPRLVNSRKVIEEILILNI
ncbi:MAG: auxin-responsive promoter family protein, partial [Bacteroidota bacterium]|nr:auxin-responsive promoter family protein [Bacteroidota bacterium]